MLTKYGLDNIIFLFIIGLVCIVSALMTGKLWLTYLLIALGIFTIGFVFVFFRDPARSIPIEAMNSDSVILSPADGKVVNVIDTYETVYLNSNARQISIFLSPLDVHVNRIPANGVIRYFKYHKGKFLAAFKSESSSDNEQTHIGIENNAGKVFFKQIVGILARRLVWDIKEGDKVKAGMRFGMMKFGSRMDVILPLGSEIYVKTGDKVRAGETIIARLK